MSQTHKDPRPDRPAPSRARALLDALEQKARKRFGQHFLTDESIVARIVRGARLESGDRVIEVGPGLGILTEALLAESIDLTAIELDRDLADHIRATFPNVRLIEGDALKVDWVSLLAGERPAKVVANLPYNIGTTLTMQLVRAMPALQSMTVMLQLEVVQRMCAEPGSKTYGALSVEIAARATPTFLLKVPPHCFYPRPGVDSAVLRIATLRDGPLSSRDGEFFDAVVRAAFGQRRKTVENALSAKFGRELARSAVADAGIGAGRRAEQLDLNAFLALTDALARAGASPSAGASAAEGR